MNEEKEKYRIGFDIGDTDVKSSFRLRGCAWHATENEARLGCAGLDVAASAVASTSVSRMSTYPRLAGASHGAAQSRTSSLKEWSDGQAEKGSWTGGGRLGAAENGPRGREWSNQRSARRFSRSPEREGSIIRDDFHVDVRFLLAEHDQIVRGCLAGAWNQQTVGSHERTRLCDVLRARILLFALDMAHLAERTDIEPDGRERVEVGKPHYRFGRIAQFKWLVADLGRRQGLTLIQVEPPLGNGRGAGFRGVEDIERPVVPTPTGPPARRPAGR